MLKKIIILVCLILGAGVFFCILLPQKKDNLTHIQFASWGSESEIKILKPVIKQFEQTHPQIKIDFMYIPQNYFQKMHLLFASNTPPDVIFVNNLNLPMFANAKVFEDLTSYCKDFECDKYFPKSIEAMKWDGKLYAIPRDVSNIVIYINKDLFKKDSVSYPTESWTLNDLQTKAIKISHPPKSFGISFEEEPLFYLPYLLAYGGWSKFDTENYFDKDVLNRTPNKKGLRFYGNLRHKYHAAPYKSEIASATSAQMFLQGKIGMLVSGRWLVPKFRQEANFDWDVVEFPALNKDSQSKVFMDASGWAISTQSTHKKEALEFVKFLSSKESSMKFTSTGLIVPARKDSAYSSAFLDNKKPKNSKTFLNAAQNSVPTPVTPNYPEIIDSLKSKTEYILN